LRMTFLFYSICIAHDSFAMILLEREVTLHVDLYLWSGWMVQC
jgi:hypothetical protein